MDEREKRQRECGHIFICKHCGLRIDSTPTRWERLKARTLGKLWNVRFRSPFHVKGEMPVQRNEPSHLPRVGVPWGWGKRI